jgi:hypothetical protein
MQSDVRPTSASTETAETSETASSSQAEEERSATPRRLRRRSLLKAGVAAGLTGAALRAGVFSSAIAEAAESGPIPAGDAAILRFLAAAEIIETDLWVQYNELGGIQDHELPGGKVIQAYAKALQQLDGDMSQYIHDNTDDEISHFTFINAYLRAKGVEPVNLDHFRKLPSSKATGARQVGRLTNLMQLSVDTSWWTRYRSSTQNPDLGDSFPQALPQLFAGQFPAIPRSDDDLKPAAHLQAIANTAGFHFGFIEQGGSSLYPSLAQRVSNPEALRILLSIGPTETSHFQTWHDKAGNAVSDPLAPLTDPTNGLTFPNLNVTPGGQDVQTNLIMPEPTVFLSRKFPRVSIIRPTETAGAAAGAVKALTDDGLFIGQPQAFFDLLQQLAEAADAAQRQ